MFIPEWFLIVCIIIFLLGRERTLAMIKGVFSWDFIQGIFGFILITGIIGAVIFGIYWLYNNITKTHISIIFGIVGGAFCVSELTAYVIMQISKFRKVDPPLWVQKKMEEWDKNSILRLTEKEKKRTLHESRMKFLPYKIMHLFTRTIIYSFVILLVALILYLLFSPKK